MNRCRQVEIAEVDASWRLDDTSEADTRDVDQPQWLARNLEAPSSLLFLSLLIYPVTGYRRFGWLDKARIILGRQHRQHVLTRWIILTVSRDFSSQTNVLSCPIQICFKVSISLICSKS